MLLEPIWNRNYVRSCRSPWPRIRLADRGAFYDANGHDPRRGPEPFLLQLLAIIGDGTAAPLTKDGPRPLEREWRAAAGVPPSP